MVKPEKEMTKISLERTQLFKVRPQHQLGKLVKPEKEVTKISLERTQLFLVRPQHQLGQLSCLTKVVNET